VTARVPFALVGVVLLVGSTAFAGSLGHPAVTDPAVDRTLDRAAAEVGTALREAVAAGSTAAAADPVTEPVEASFGSTLNRTATFRDALRVRIYVTLRDRLRRLSGSRNGLDVTVGLPATPTPESLRRAKRQTTVERATDGAGLRVRVRGITITARRDGRTVARRTLSPAVTVPVPTLAIHDRVREFQRRLTAGPAEPGLGRRLTARLNVLAWARGYAQFGGAPITNVIANRHVALLTNGAILSAQRARFGQSDPRGRSLLGIGAARTGLTDVLGGTDHPIVDALSTAREGSGPPLPATERIAKFGSREATPADGNISASLDDTADAVLLETLREIDRPLRRTYRVPVERRTAVEQLGTDTISAPSTPDGGWTLDDVETTTTATAEPRSEPPPTPDGEWHTLAHQTSTVTVTKTTVRHWVDGNATERTVERRRTRYAVDVAVVGRHDGGRAPTRPIQNVHRPGGPLEGPNLADIPETARERLLASHGGADAVARRAAIDGEGTSVSAAIVGDRPDGLSEWVRADLLALAERVGSLSVSVRREAVAELRANPAERLLGQFRERRSALLGVPDRYVGVADRARVAARRAYHRRVESTLETRAKQYHDASDRFRERLRERDVGPLGGAATPPESRPSDGQGIQMRVVATPAYLTLGGIDGDRLPGTPQNETVHPLATRNVNVAAVPYGDVADEVVSGLLGSGSVRLGTAGRLLRATTRLNDTAARSLVDTSDLRSAVSDANGYLVDRAASALGRATRRDSEQRRAVVSEALEPWPAAADRAVALTNGSAARAIHETAVERWSLTGTDAELLAIRVERAIADGRSHSSARPPQSAVSGPAGRLRDLVTTELATRLGDRFAASARRALDAATRRSVSALPAGLPLVPAPGAWYVTVNAWRVQVRGQYARFAVTVPRGTPDDPGALLRYVRDGQWVGLDVDSDGETERLGRAPRISVRTHAVAVVAVPPAPQGVGDKDGVRDERSPGWAPARGE
jgi:hypothetical protein